MQKVYRKFQRQAPRAKLKESFGKKKTAEENLNQAKHFLWVSNYSCLGDLRITHNKGLSEITNQVCHFKVRLSTMFHAHTFEME